MIFLKLFQMDCSKIELLMAVVKYKTKMHKPRKGICSTWLSSLNPKESKYQ